MFTLTDFINLMKYYKNEASGMNPDINMPEMDTKLKSTAEDSKAKSTTLFNESIDQLCHSTDDYKRLKNFLIAWYSSLKTFPTIMKGVSDIRILPDEHLNELFKSFGFDIGLNEIPKANKIDFFYDLVNLYKIKGTPESLERALVYFGIPEVDLIEYWLQYDEDRNLVFRPQLLSNKANISTLKDLEFDYTTSLDCHWMYTADEINALFNNNKIAFPSKTPYFGLRPTVQLIGNIINPIMCILTRLILDQYEAYMSGSPPTKDTHLPIFDVYVNILDLYIGVIYAFNTLYPKTFNPSELYTYIYNGPFEDSSGAPITYQDIISLFDEIICRANTSTRDDINETRELFNATFTKLRSENFLTSLTTAGTVLAITNPELKNVIDVNFSMNNEEKTLQLLVKNLVLWVQTNIDPRCPNLLVTMFGMNILDHITQVINFFKPYHARLILIEHTFTIKLPALDTVIPEDYFNPDGIDMELTFWDWDTADSKPSYQEFEYPAPVTSTPYLDCTRRINNIYVDSTGIVICEYIDTPGVPTPTDVYSTPPIGSFRVSNIYLQIGEGDSRVLHVISDISPDTVGTVSSLVYSIAPAGYYQILDIYMNCDTVFEMLYNGTVSDGIDPNWRRLYYSRDLMDCGSYYDIGASSDDPPYDDEDHVLTRYPLFTYITHSEIDKYNYHIGDTTSGIWYEIEYRTDEEGDLQPEEVRIAGGWYGFDEDLVFDMPPITDLCLITVTDVPPPEKLYSDVEIDYHTDVDGRMPSITPFVAD